MKFSALLYSIALHGLVLVLTLYSLQHNKKQFDAPPIFINLTGFEYKENAVSIGAKAAKKEVKIAASKAKPEIKNEVQNNIIEKQKPQPEPEAPKPQEIAETKPTPESTAKLAQTAPQKPEPLKQQESAVEEQKKQPEPEAPKPQEMPKIKPTPKNTAKPAQTAPQKPAPAKQANKKVPAPPSKTKESKKQQNSAPKKVVSNAKSKNEPELDELLNSLDQETSTSSSEPGGDIWQTASSQANTYPADFILAKDLLQNKIEANWNKPLVMQDYQKLKIKLELTLDINQSIRGVSEVTLSDPSVPRNVANIIKNSILRAIYSSEPIDCFKLEHYEYWNKIVLVFSY